MNKLQSIINTAILPNIKIVSHLALAHPYLTAVVAIFLYLVCFQWDFITTGDAWAESHAEYLVESIHFGWKEVVAQNWGGYFSLVPSFIAKAYVYIGLPIGYIDWFYRAVVILFAVLTAALVAHRYNRALIPSDALRIVLAVGLMAILFDVASFSFINVWYLALLPVMLLYLNPNRLSFKADLLVGVGGALIALTKPLPIIVPFIVYRIVKTRQWIGASILLAATLIQTYQILFNDRRQVVENASISLVDSILGVFVGSGVSLMKLIGIPPVSFWLVIIANAALVALLVLLWKKRGLWVALLLGLVYVYSVYTYVLAPDSQVYHGLDSYAAMQAYNFKTQREILINGTLIMSVFILLGAYLESWQRSTSTFLKDYRKVLIFGAALTTLLLTYQPIDTKSAAVSTQTIEAFRATLNADRPTCVPISPTPVFIGEANWTYEHRAKCHTPHHNTALYTPDFQHMNTPANNVTIAIDGTPFTLQEKKLAALTVPVNNRTGDANTLTLTDKMSGKSYTTAVLARPGIQFIAFNTEGLPVQTQYEFTIQQARDGLTIGRFTDRKTPLTYPYYMDE